MTKVRGVTGGGIESRQTTHVTAKKTEPVNHSVSMNRPSMLSKIKLLVWEAQTKVALIFEANILATIGTTPMYSSRRNSLSLPLPCSSGRVPALYWRFWPPHRRIFAKA